MSAPELAPELLPQVKSWLTPTSGLATGDVLTLHIQITAKPGVDVAIPEQPLAPFELIDQRTTEQAQAGSQQLSFELDLLALEPGTLTVPALALRVVGPAGELAELHTESVTVQVTSLIQNEPNAEPKGPTGPVVVMQDDYTLAWAGGGVAAAALLIAITLLVQRWLARRPKLAPPLPPPEPPWQIALAQLAQLERQKAALLESGRGEQLVAELSNILREYLGRRYGFDGLECTTDEVLSRLERLRPAKISLSSVQLLLADCDLVKFARMPPSEPECDGLFTGITTIVRATTPPPLVSGGTPAGGPS